MKDSGALVCGGELDEIECLLHKRRIEEGGVENMIEQLFVVRSFARTLLRFRGVRRIRGAPPTAFQLLEQLVGCSAVPA